MGNVLAINLADDAVGALRMEETPLGIRVLPHDLKHALGVLEGGGGDIEAVVVGEVQDPVSAAQRSHKAAPDAPVLLIRPETDCEPLLKKLRLTPFVGLDIECVPAATLDVITQHVRKAVERARRRRSFDRTIGNLNRKLAESVVHRPAAAGLLGRLLEVAPVGIVRIDPAGLIHEVNQKGAALLGATPGYLTGRAIWDVLGSGAEERVRSYIRRLAEEADLVNAELLTVNHPHGPLHVEMSGTSIAAETGGPGFLILLQDVTERVDLVSRLEEANRRKDEFLAMLGHELRNPLAPIKAALDLMRMRGDQPLLREREVIERHVGHLLHLVGDLLDVSKAVRGKIELRRRPVEVATIVAEAIEIASPLLEQRHHHLEFHAAHDKLAVYGDERRLAQVVSNLLTNAAKYTKPHGRIIISTSLDGPEVVILVRDNGRGIDAQMLPHVFGLFVQEKQAIDRSEGGLGIGLAIVKSLVEMHGGTVSVSSEAGRGSEFVVRLPAVEAEAVLGNRPGGAALVPAVTSPKRRVLLVDDNEDAAFMLSALLEAFGFVVKMAPNGPTALAVAPEFVPNVAVLDIGLPVMDGYELARQLRALPNFSTIPLIAITGYGQSEDRARSAAAGFDAHLVKPVDADAVRVTIERLTAGFDLIP